MYVNRVSFVPTVALLHETAKNFARDREELAPGPMYSHTHAYIVVYISHINRVHLV